MVSGPVRVAVGLTVLVLLSGCSGGKGKDADHDDEPVDDVDALVATGNVTAVIEVSVDGVPLAAVNGSFPVVVGTNVTFNASRSTGGQLTFEWDLAGKEANGMTVVHRFEALGTHTVGLTVVGRSAFDEAEVVLNVTSGGPPAGTVIHTQRESFSGSLTLGNPNAPSQAGVDYADHAVVIAAATPNGTGLAKTVRITLVGSGTLALEMTVYWRDAAGNLANEGSGLGAADASLEYSEDMPPGDYTVRVRLNTGAEADYDVTVEVDYVSG